MTQNAICIDEIIYNPLESVEQFVFSRQWPSERLNDHELLACIQGKCCNYQTTFSWDQQISLLHLAFSFEIGLPREGYDMMQNSELNKFLILANERLSVGHFDLWREESAIVWRFGLPMKGLMLDDEYVESLINIAVENCERYFPAFQYVLWGGVSASHMLHISMFDTIGNA